MDLISIDEGVDRALGSMLNQRLALLAGAGLSMAPPSSLPSAAALAQSAKARYDAMFGANAPALSLSIEEQAQYFFQRNELASVYFRSLVDPHAFAGIPNAGHTAVADLLLVTAIQTAVTTNVDTLIETAGLFLFGQIGVGIDVATVAAVAPNVSPLLKIHGCRVCDLPNMVWAPGQLAVDPVAARLAQSAHWLSVRLRDHDLLVVGFWTDWAYLNEVLDATLNGVNPSRVIVVDPQPSAALSTKAPALFAVGNRAAAGFHHVQESGSVFLDLLRQRFSTSFYRQTLHAGIADYIDRKGAPVAGWTEPPPLDSDTLWRVRRDLEGCLPNKPATLLRPSADGLVGQTLLDLQATGATSDGQYWRLNGQRIRVIRAARPLHRVQKDFERETAPAVAPDVVIAVGAEAQQLPMSVARATSGPSIARGSSSRWLTRPEAIVEFGL